MVRTGAVSHGLSCLILTGSLTQDLHRAEIARAQGQFARLRVLPSACVLESWPSVYKSLSILLKVSHFISGV